MPAASTVSSSDKTSAASTATRLVSFVQFASDMNLPVTQVWDHIHQGRLPAREIQGELFIPVQKAKPVLPPLSRVATARRSSFGVQRSYGFAGPQSAPRTEEHAQDRANRHGRSGRGDDEKQSLSAIKIPLAQNSSPGDTAGPAQKVYIKPSEPYGPSQPVDTTPVASSSSSLSTREEISGLQQDRDIRRVFKEMLQELQQEVMAEHGEFFQRQLQMLQQEKKAITQLSESYLAKIRTMTQEILGAKDELLLIKDQSLTALKEEVQVLQRQLEEKSERLSCKEQELEDMQVLNQALSKEGGVSVRTSL